MKWIIEIVKKEPFKVVCRWNDNQLKTVDLYDFILKKSKSPDSSYTQLLNKDRFLQVKCDGTTLFWENGINYQDLDGTIKPGPLDIAPEVLYEISV